MVSNYPFYGNLKRYWVRRRYHRLDGSVKNRKSMKVARLGDGRRRRLWKIKAIPKLRLKIASPLKLWHKLKDSYINMMLNLAGNVGQLNNGNAFGTKRIPKARKVPVVYSNDEFENRLIFEIYKALTASRELGGTIGSS
ncbi:uncharacterized protein LOC131168501 [Malania oleifera]|uniref:uncharacterized protein LOC131168501 n=1 Tax=Malania oleifera TaxID=397392 RepID=UPI0025ADD7EA|nr:uncharacterized protein LOC131168501 [Malania oleifera]